MATTNLTVNGHIFKFDNDDVVNPEDYVPQGGFNPHNVRPWLLHDHGFTLAVIFAENLHDALDIAVDNGKMEAYRVSSEYDDYIENDDLTCAFLGDAGEPFDLDNIGFVELNNKLEPINYFLP